MMKGIEPCPTMEELEAKANALFAEDIKQHEVRTKDVVAQLTAKGVIVDISPHATFTSYCTEVFGTKFQQRQLTSHGWNLGFVRDGDVSNQMFFISLGKLLEHLEARYLPEEKDKWEPFDKVYDNRITRIRHELAHIGGHMTVVMAGTSEPAKWILEVFNRDNDRIVASPFDHLSQLLAFMEERMKLK